MLPSSRDTLQTMYLDKTFWQTSYNIFINLHWENIAPFIQRIEGALQTLAFKKQVHLKIWILAVKSLQLQVHNFLEAEEKQFYFSQWKRLRKSLDLLSQYRHFPKPGAGLTKQKHTNLNEQYLTPYFKSKTQGLRRQNLPTVLDLQTEQELMQVTY